MDRELPARVVLKRRIRIVGSILGVALVLILVVCALRAAISPTLDRSKLRISVAQMGRIEATISGSGVVVPEFEQTITSPIASTVEQVFFGSGDTVRVGQSVVLLNKDALALSLDRLRDELELLQTNKQQLSLQLDRQALDLQARYDIKDLQTQFVRSQHERARHLYDLGGTTGEELNRAALNVEIAERELQQLAEQMENQQASLRAELKALDLQIRIQESELADMLRRMDLAEAKAASDGVVTWVSDVLGVTVAAGEPVARIADLGSFKIEGTISDIHAERLRVGGPVKVRLGERYLTGQIASVQPAVQNGVMKFTVTLDDRADPGLRPSLRVDVHVVTSFKDDLIRVKNGPFNTGSVGSRVFVVEGDRAIAREASVGVANYDWVELTGDIAVGDSVIISNMEDYRHMDEIDIKK